MTALQSNGGLYYLCGAVSFAQFANDGTDPATDSLDGNTYTTGLSRVFTTGWSRLTGFSLGADLESADTEGADYRYRSIALHSDSTLAFTPRWSLIPEAGIGYRNYYDFTGTVDRDELIWRTAIRSRFQLSKSLSVSGVASYDRFVSDNASFDAERTQVGVVTTFVY